MVDHTKVRSNDALCRRNVPRSPAPKPPGSHISSMAAPTFNEGLPATGRRPLPEARASARYQNFAEESFAAGRAQCRVVAPRGGAAHVDRKRIASGDELVIARAQNQAAIGGIHFERHHREAI